MSVLLLTLFTKILGNASTSKHWGIEPTTFRLRTKEQF